MRHRWMGPDFGGWLYELIPLQEDHLIRPREPLNARCLAHFNDGSPLFNLDVITHLRVVHPLVVVVRL